MKKSVLTAFLVIVMTIMLSHPLCHAESINHPPQGTKTLLYHDIFVSLLNQKIDKRVDEYYSQIFSEHVVVYPYNIDVVDTKRVGGNRSFNFLVTLELYPVVGPHIQVGVDQITFQIDPSGAEIKKYKHIKTITLPKHWQHIVR